MWDRRRAFDFGAAPCYCCRDRSGFGGEAVYPQGCRETRGSTLPERAEVFGCPQDNPVSVGLDATFLGRG